MVGGCGKGVLGGGGGGILEGDRIVQNSRRECVGQGRTYAAAGAALPLISS